MMRRGEGSRGPLRTPDAAYIPPNPPRGVSTPPYGCTRTSTCPPVSSVFFCLANMCRENERERGRDADWVSLCVLCVFVVPVDLVGALDRGV